jgi:aspartate aminotransferase-like enzyme
VLALVCGDFSERWADVFARNGKHVTILEVPRGEANTADSVAKALRARSAPFDAIAIVHNETSTGVRNPLDDIVLALRAHAPETLILVDAVSSLAGDKIDVDGLGLDVTLTSSQKCFGLPPGLAFAAVSDRALARAATIPNRGYYFDFLELEAFGVKNNTPSTPAISLMRALDRQLADILAEGLEQRFSRHAALARMTREWADEMGFGLFAAPGFESQTVTVVTNTRNVDVGALNKSLAARGLSIADGYGGLKGKTFRIAHMADASEADMRELFAAINEHLTHV